MATQATIGHGSTFSVGITPGPPITYGIMAEVVSITGPALQRDTPDATHMLSPAKFREFIGGLKDAGEVSLTLNFRPGSTDEEVIFAHFDSDVIGDYKITFPNAAEWEFQAWCTGYDTETPLDDKMSATVTFKLSGKPAFVTYAPPAVLAAEVGAAGPGAA